MKKRMLILILFWVAMTGTLVVKAQNSSTMSGAKAAGQTSSFEFNTLFEPTPKFEQGSYIMSVAIGFRSDTKITEFENKVSLPALSFTIEKAVAKNIGVGLFGGVQMWTVPVYNYKYRQFNAGLKASYHLNISEKLDPYVALGGAFRYMDVQAEEYYNSKFKFSAAFLLGCRYYFKERIAVFGEAGDDTLTWFRVGLALKLK